MTPSEHHDELTKVPLNEYLLQHAKRNGGWKDFLRSNLATALIIFILGQLIIGVGAFWRITTAVEKVGRIETKMEDMDKNGTTYNRYREEDQAKDLGGIKERLRQVEKDTEHLDVYERERARITEDLEKLKANEMRRLIDEASRNKSSSEKR